jgi:hypothetical protein
MSAIGNVGARYRKQVLPRRLQKLAAVYDPEPTSAFNVYASIIRALQRPDSQTLGRLSNDPMGHFRRQISKARQTAIGSALVFRPRYLAVFSILA